MRAPPLLMTALLAATVLAGCSSGADGFDPYAQIEPTGNTVHLKMTVVDLLSHQIYPGFRANMWAFCVQPANPSDTYSANAIEYWSSLETDAQPAGGLEGKCSVPGPTIRVKQGDKVIVDFAHSHFHAHTIHWHGQFVPELMDGAPGVSQDVVEGGQAFRYEFLAKKAGTLWYHCHVDTQLHIMQGLYGLFIVEPQSTAHEADEAQDIPRDQEYYMVLGHLRRSLVEAPPGSNPHGNHGEGCLVSGRPRCQNPPVDTTPDTFVLNGHSYPQTMDQVQKDGKRGSLIELEEGKRYRLRILNAGQETETVHPHGHDMLVTHRDGNPLPQPFWVDTLSVGPAERYDAILVANNPGVWMIHTHVNDHETNDFQSSGGIHTMMVYHGFHDKMHRFPNAELPGGLPYNPSPQAIPSDIVRQRTFPTQTTPDSSGLLTYTFETPLMCAVQGLQVTVSSTATGSLFQQLTNLTVEVLNRDGDIVATLPMGAGSEVTWTMAPDRTSSGTVGEAAFEFPFKPFEDGNVTVKVRGRMVETSVTVTSVVDYYGSFEQAKQGAEFYKHSHCVLTPDR